MKNLLAPKVPLALVLLAVAAVALRAAARRPEAPGTGLAPVTVTGSQSQPRPAVITGKHDGTGRAMARAPAPRPAESEGALHGRPLRRMPACPVVASRPATRDGADSPIKSPRDRRPASRPARRGSEVPVMAW